MTEDIILSMDDFIREALECRQESKKYSPRLLKKFRMQAKRQFRDPKEYYELIDELEKFMIAFEAREFR